MIKDKIKEALFWILITVSIFLLLWRIFGDSPTSDLIIYPLIMALIVNAWSTKEDISFLKARFENFEKQFSALAKDFKVHLVESREVKENLSILSSDFKEHLKNHG